MRTTTLATILLVLLSTTTRAGPSEYECKIREVYDVADEGVLRRDESNLIFVVGAVFHVDRDSGIALGSGLNNEGAKNLRVIDPGSKDSGFKVQWWTPVIGLETAVNLASLTVQEFVEGNVKPFVFFQGWMVIVGTCT